MVSARATDWNLIQALPRSKRTPDIQTANLGAHSMATAWI
jgi:hypothetical protein